jgi:hypothetical protein
VFFVPCGEFSGSVTNIGFATVEEGELIGSGLSVYVWVLGSVGE